MPHQEKANDLCHDGHLGCYHRSLWLELSVVAPHLRDNYLKENAYFPSPY
jgi:hypothetical protein